MVSPQPKLLLSLVFFTLSFYGVVRSDTVTENASSPLRFELDQLRSRTSILEKIIGERVEELKRRDNKIKATEKNIWEKLDYIASLNVQIRALQKGSPEAGELKAKMYAKSNELSNQADKLRKEIEAQVKKKDDLEVLIYSVEKKINELYQKLGSLRKINDEQRTRISKIKHDIQSAEEELLKLKIEASLASEEMVQTYTISLWNEHGRPGLEWAIQKALDVKAIVWEWAGPHNKVVKKEAKQFLKPYLAQISVTSKPHADKLTCALKRYTREIVKIYERLMRSVMAHHTQVQDIALELLKGHEYTRPFADKDIVWYLASAIFALPAILIVNLYTILVSNKPRKRSNKHHARHGAKRLRPEN